MKVIFLQNLDDYKVGDIKEVAEGYARNFLIKKGIAEFATEAKVKEIEGQLGKIKKEEAEKAAQAQKVADEISKKTLEIKQGVNEEGHLYGSVGAKDIAEALKEQAKLEVDGGDIIIAEPIKELGKHSVVVKVGHGVETELKISVVRE